MVREAGLLNRDEKPVEPTEVMRLVSSPKTGVAATDERDVYCGGAIGLFCGRLDRGLGEEWGTIGKLIISARGRAVKWNGRLDNRAELLNQVWEYLQGNKDDAAVVAAAFDRWGVECFKRLVGDWAVVVWDRDERRLWLARDYLGVKSLFYYQRGATVLWCDDLAGLVLSGDSFHLCDEYIAGCLVSKPRAHLTPYMEIKAVPPGGFVCVSDTDVTTHRYWNCRRTEVIYSRESEYVDEFRHLFRQAVRRRLCGPGPILAELSGGFDSSSVVCMADRILEQESCCEVVHTLSFVDSKEPGADDADYFTAVERQRGRQGHHVDLKGQGNSLHFECGEFAAVPRLGLRVEAQEAVTRLIREHGYRAILSGTGGDEVTGQVADVYVQMADALLRGQFATLWKQLVGWSLATGMPLVWLLSGAMRQLLPEQLRQRREKHRLWEPWMTRNIVEKCMESYVDFRGADGSGNVGQPVDRDWCHTMGHLARIMCFRDSSAVEKRYPYLDETLVDFLVNVPFDRLSQPSNRRYLVKNAFVGLLPHEILERRWKSIGASRAYAVSIERHWGAVCKLIEKPLLEERGFIYADKFRECLVEFKSGTISPVFIKLLQALHVEIWLRDVVRRGIVTL